MSAGTASNNFSVAGQAWARPHAERQTAEQTDRNTNRQADRWAVTTAHLKDKRDFSKCALKRYEMRRGSVRSGAENRDASQEKTYARVGKTIFEL